MRELPAWPVDAPFRVPGGFLVPRASRVPGLTSSRDQDLWVGHGAAVQGPIRHGGAVMLCRGATVAGPVSGGHEVIIGAHCLAGSVDATGRIIIQHGARVDDLDAGSDVFLLGDCEVGNVTCNGDIIVAGAPRTGTLQPGGRVVTRAY